ncbi:unnamed protein product [Rhizophagus irregularis]|nr:unnamed protein product [Rhizophagus irregularis]
MEAIVGLLNDRAEVDDSPDNVYLISTCITSVDLLANPSELEPNAENAVLVDEIFELKSENAKLRNPEARECIE